MFGVCTDETATGGNSFTFGNHRVGASLTCNSVRKGRDRVELINGLPWDYVYVTYEYIIPKPGFIY